jgi:arginyl-tRNA synthetase
MAEARKTVFALVLDSVRAANNALITNGVLPEDIDQSRVVVELTRDPSHGDIATNDAMVLAAQVGSVPRQLADKLAAELRLDERFLRVDVAAPGFVNLTLRPKVWIEELGSALLLGKDYGRSNLGKRRRVNVEYVSANPTGPVHVGHARGAVFGDALAKVLTFTGHRVTREYYVNDAGAQVEVLARSAFLRYREALGEAVGSIPEGLYPGDYLKEVGAALAAEFRATLLDKPEAEWLPLVRDKAVAMMMASISTDLAKLKIKHRVFSSERKLIEGEFSQVQITIEALRAKGLVYEGRLPPPKGRPIEDWEDREQLLFRSTAYSDVSDRPLRKSDGSYTYFATDIAYHKSKFDRGFRTMIDVWGADHGGYVKRVQAAVNAVTGGQAELDVKIMQLVRLLRAGQPIKMSKRAGEFVTLREVVDEVGRDAVRFMMLYRKNDAPLDFDLAKVIEQSRDNPVFYVQYAHARGQSVFRNARAVVPDLPNTSAKRGAWLARAPLERLVDDGELALIKRLALYPRIVEGAASAHEPHRISFYLYDLASEFHAQWRRGEESSDLRFIIPDDPRLTTARLALIQGVVAVLASGLRRLGVRAPTAMR